MPAAWRTAYNNIVLFYVDPDFAVIQPKRQRILF